MSLNLDSEMTVSGQTRYAFKLPGNKGCLVVAAVVFSVVLNIALVTTVGVIAHSKSSHQHSTCDTASCVETAARVANSLNTSHPACSDFYEYACGGYKLHHNIEPGAYTYTVWTELVETSSKRMRTAIESVDQNQKYGKEVSALFASCMDLKAINDTNSKPLLDILNKGDTLQWPTLAGSSWDRKKNFDMSAWLQTLHQININTFFTLTKGPNPAKANHVNLKIYPSGLNMYKWDYVSTDSWAQKRQDEYRKRLVDLISKLGVVTNTTAIEEDVNEVFDFEVKLAQITPDWRKDIFQPKVLRLRGLYNDYFPITQFNWRDYVAALFPSGKVPDDSTEILIEEQDYFGNLSSLLSTTSDRVLANYFSISLVYNLADHLPAHISGQISAHRRYDYESAPLYYQCAVLTEKLMPWAALRSMLDRKLISDKAAAVEVFENLRAELVAAVESVSDKFTPDFAQQLKARVASLHEKIGYPTWLTNQEDVNKFYNKMTVTLDPKQYLSNVLEMSKFRKGNILMSTEEEYHDGEGWDWFFADYTGSYYLHGNDIFLPSYYLFSPVYSNDMPAAFNYGGLGAWAGYYMVYALEDDWRRYHTENGTILPLEPSVEDAAAYTAVKACNDYIANKTYLPPGETVPIPISFNNDYGVLYQHNDIIATNMAYKAFKKHNSGNQYAPALPQSSDQIFFLATGQFYCSAKYDHHSYYHKLLNAIAASRPEFSKAFGCTSDDLLYNDGNKVCYL